MQSASLHFQNSAPVPKALSKLQGPSDKVGGKAQASSHRGHGDEFYVKKLQGVCSWKSLFAKNLRNVVFVLSKLLRLSL